MFGGSAGRLAKVARCYTQQIFSCSAAGIDRDTSLSDYRDVLLVRRAVCAPVCVCVCVWVLVIADHCICLI